MFGIGGFELFIIILFGFLIFGPDKLPEIAKTVGMAINKFKKAKDEMDGVIKEEIFDPTSPEPFKNPAKAIDRAHSVAKKKVARPESEETFAERKARYDRERAEAKKRAQLTQEQQSEIDANRAKMKKEAAEKAEKIAEEQTASKKPTAAQLYGTAPLDESLVRKQKAPEASTPEGGEQ